MDEAPDAETGLRERHRRERRAVGHPSTPAPSPGRPERVEHLAAEPRRGG